MGKSNQSFERQGTKRPAGATDPNESITNRVAKMGANRHGAWATLLSQRPSSNDGDDMSAWLMQVMSVSDLNNPVHDGPTHVGSADFNPMMYATMKQGSNNNSTPLEMDKESANDSSSDTTCTRNAANESSTPSESGSSDDSSNDSISDESQETNDSAKET